MFSSLTSMEFFQRPLFLLGMPDASDLVNALIVIIIVFAVYGLVKASQRSLKVVHGHWHHMFETVPFAPTDFYTTLETGIKEKEIPGISFSQITHSEHWWFLSADRLYLRIKFREYKIDICAAPFAKESFFVSWWLGESGFRLWDYLVSIPVIGRLFTRRQKTLFELDTEIMFKELISRCVKETIEGLVETKGLRQLNAIDWREKGPELKYQ
jgi:hypothetical protein